MIIINKTTTREIEITVCELSQSERETLSRSEQIPEEKSRILKKKKSVKWKPPTASNWNLSNINCDKKRRAYIHVCVTNLQ